MSVETYTIEKVSSNVREVPLEHGTFKSYGFTCVGREGVFSLLQKPDSAPPKAGDTFEATVKNVFTPDGGGAPVTNLKKVQQQRGNNGGGRGPRDPQERKSIQAQACQKVAVDVVRLSASGSNLSTLDDFTSAVETATERLFAQVERLAG